MSRYRPGAQTSAGIGGQTAGQEEIAAPRVINHGRLVAWTWTGIRSELRPGGILPDPRVAQRAGNTIAAEKQDRVEVVAVGHHVPHAGGRPRAGWRRLVGPDGAVPGPCFGAVEVAAEQDGFAVGGVKGHRGDKRIGDPWTVCMLFHPPPAFPNPGVRQRAVRTGTAKQDDLPPPEVICHGGGFASRGAVGGRDIDLDPIEAVPEVGAVCEPARAATTGSGGEPAE